MRFLSSKLALPMASALAVVSLVGVQAIALSQAPSDEISIPAGADAINTDQMTEPAATDPQPSTTPIVIPTDGPTALPDDDDEYEDDEYEDEDDDDEYEDDDEEDDEDDD